MLSSIITLMITICLLFLIKPSCSLVHLVESASLRTAGSAGFEFFSIGNENYIGAANFWDGKSQDMSAYSTVSRVFIDPTTNKLKLTEVQRFRTKGAHGVDVFNTNKNKDDVFLSIPNYYGCGSDRGPAKDGCDSTFVYKYNNTDQKFHMFQTLRTSGPAQTDHFVLNDQNIFLIVGENFNDEVCIYKLEATDSLFTKHSCLKVPGAGSMAIINEGDDGIFLIASSYHDNGWRTNTRIYRADTTDQDLVFTEHQRILTYGCHDAEVGKFSTGTFVFLSEDRSESSSTIESSLLIYNPSSKFFQIHQRIPGDGAHAAELFEGPDGAVYLFIANFGDRLCQRYASFSTLWRQNGNLGQFEQISRVSSQGATDVEHFVVQGRHFLGLSNEGDIGNRKHQVSVFYELVTGNEEKEKKIKEEEVGKKSINEL
jgi:hypothetical protein